MISRRKSTDGKKSSLVSCFSILDMSSLLHSGVVRVGGGREEEGERRKEMEACAVLELSSRSKSVNGSSPLTRKRKAEGSRNAKE